MINIKSGDSITLLDNDSNIYKEMICFDVGRELNQRVYYFQSVDKNGLMQIDKIPESILNVLNWKESLIPRFFAFEEISDILELHQNLSQLDFKGFTASYFNILGGKNIESIILYLKNNNLYLEIICFGNITTNYKRYNHFFKDRSENIPYIYVKETNNISELHLNDENKMFYLFNNQIDSFQIKDISCWSGKDYLNKLVIPSNYVPNIQQEITLDGFGVEFCVNHAFNMKKDLKGESILIFGHHNVNCLDFFDTGILVDEAWYLDKPVNSLSFVRGLKN